MQNRRLQPGTLWPAMLRQTEHALRCGALQRIQTSQTVLESDGIRFVVRQVSSLIRKEQQRRQTQQRPSANPFLPYEPDLFVADISDTHLALLNKFNVIDNHLLIVTRNFQSQNALLNLADFESLIVCMAEFDGIGFYNAGAAAGASQAHKHLQIVPLPLGVSETTVPIEPILATTLLDGLAQNVPGLPFRHAFARLEPGAAISVDAAPSLLSCYRALLEAVGIQPVEVDGELHQSAPYNLLVTRRWMLLVPRSEERVEGVSINALGFAGSLFVRDAAQMKAIERLGPMAALQRVALPVNALR
ncbi:ATP adenylyltransferase family protein [Paraburkholderia phytofirmans]|uniref:Ap4A phosphorylase II n=1 Tax=Paraburkholderia phytofirmans (strain DSM 17436 / LMG 22146 / PsJN) TaxID=398527 RepID=B2TDQ3_PARPJ|nr:phosphorylase [Paraburkholderia phytofirmans]ACD19093.1 Ap4A phosphorylase II [Paraburkholderia phytofirmans PsJN]